MDGDSKPPPPVLQVPKLAPNIDVDDDNKMVGIYLELPTATRRRRSLQPSITSDNGSVSSISITGDEMDDDLFDSPRLFTELLTLTESDEKNVTWKEAARWVRFEEDVEEGGQRWSKPRVSTLLLHSFFELRSYLVNGIVCLDLEGNSMESIFNNVVSHSSFHNKLCSTKIDKIQGTLGSNCIHLFEIKTIKESIKNGVLSKRKSEKRTKGSIKEVNSDTATVDEESGNGNYKGNRQFMKKLPEGTEAASVLVGEMKYIDKTIIIFVRLKDKVDLGSLTEVPVPSRFLFFIFGPMGSMEVNFEIGRTIATLFSDEVFREVAFKAKHKSHLLAGMDEFLDASTLLPPGEWDPAIKIEPPAEAPTKAMRKKGGDSIVVDEEEEERKLRESSGLTRSGRLFGGFLNDIKRKAPWYWSDFKDALSLQSVAAFFFLYFACLAPIVTFGGLLGEATNNNIAVMESLMSGLVSGVVYGFFSGQPLTLLGSTGPVLVFETILHQFCLDWGWDYLSFRLWIGAWAGLILMALVAFDASSLVCYITRFTEENFATLISLIYIVKAVEKVVLIGTKYPMMTNVDEMKHCNCVISDDIDLFGSGSFEYNFSMNEFSKEDCIAVNGTLTGNSCVEYQPDVFLLSLILFFGTYIIATYLKGFKASSFFPTWARSFISDFAVILAIIIMTIVDMRIGIHTPKLLVPSDFKPTSPDRGWVIPPFNGNPWWTSLVAVVPAFLACILIFMDQQITSVIVNRKEHKLKKGGGYHLDLFVLSILIIINSIMGLPWFVAATVLSINHVSSLKKESECAAPGEKPQFLGVRENRVTHILIFVFIGLSVFMTPILGKIPMAVLFGVFLYMGIAALDGIQFFDRILLMFMPVKYQPNHTYLKKVPLKKVHMFTYIQLACLIVLWIIKSFNQTSLLFPLMLVVMVGIRKMLDLLFTQRELKILDDVLPEYKRKEKIEEESDEEEITEDEAKHYKGQRTMSISVEKKLIVNPNQISLNVVEEPRKLSVSKLSIEGISNLRQRRRSSILEPIFTTPHYYEGEVTLRLPSENDFVQFQRKKSYSNSKDALQECELESLRETED